MMEFGRDKEEISKRGKEREGRERTFRDSKEQQGKKEHNDLLLAGIMNSRSASLVCRL